MGNDNWNWWVIKTKVTGEHERSWKEDKSTYPILYMCEIFKTKEKLIDQGFKRLV